MTDNAMTLNDSTLRALVKSLRADSRDVGTENLPGAVALENWRDDALDAGDDKLVATIEAHAFALARLWDEDRNAENADALRAAIERAMGTWTGADWNHELRRDGRPVLDADGVPIWCQGGEDCETCASAEDDAAEAEAHARHALVAIGRGDFAEAAHELKQARDLEAEYGESTTWDAAWRMADRIESGEPARPRLGRGS